MKPIVVTKGISITKTRTISQRCLACGERFVPGTVAFNFHNYDDGLILKKNLWLHINCRKKLCVALNVAIKKHDKNITIESI